jgi:hypothetical protein
VNARAAPFALEVAIWAKRKLVAMSMSRESSRSEERSWRSEHRAELEKLVRQWIVVEGKELIAHDLDPVTAIQEAQNQGDKCPFFFRAELPGWDCKIGSTCRPTMD